MKMMMNMLYLPEATSLDPSVTTGCGKFGHKSADCYSKGKSEKTDQGSKNVLENLKVPHQGLLPLAKTKVNLS
jgi:hypothetical protein